MPLGRPSAASSSSEARASSATDPIGRASYTHFATLLAVGVATARAGPAGASSNLARLLAPAGICRFSDDSNASIAMQTKAMACLTRFARSADGYRACGNPSKLRHAVAMKLDADLRCHQLSHEPCGQPFGTVYSDSGYLVGPYSVGENLAWGRGIFGTPREIMRAWLLSPPHRENLLSTAWREFGIAVRVGVRFDGRADVAIWAPASVGADHELARPVTPCWTSPSSAPGSSVSQLRASCSRATRGFGWRSWIRRSRSGVTRPVTTAVSSTLGSITRRGR